MAFTDNGRNPSDKNAISWAIEAQKLGAGEILLTSVDNEGTGHGLDTQLISQIMNEISVPLIAHGGVGNINDVFELTTIKNISGVAIASMFHYDSITVNRNLEGYDDEGNTEFLKNNRFVSHIESSSILQLKQYLSSKGILVRV